MGDLSVQKKTNEKKRIVDLVSDKFLTAKENEWADYELVDISYVKEGPSRYLRLFIDKEGGIDLEDCEFISRGISEYLDSLDPIKETYILEVSSPGVERPLNKLDDYKRFTGKLAEIKLYAPLNGLKMYTGTILEVEGDEVVLEIKEANSKMNIPFEKIASARLKFVFE